MDMWKVLEIEPTDDLNKIFQAYSTRTRQSNLYSNPKEYQELSEAYQSAQKYAREQQMASWSNSIYQDYFFEPTTSSDPFFQSSASTPIIFDSVEPSAVSQPSATQSNSVVETLPPKDAFTQSQQESLSQNTATMNSHYDSSVQITPTSSIPSENASKPLLSSQPIVIESSQVTEAVSSVNSFSPAQKDSSYRNTSTTTSYSNDPLQHTLSTSKFGGTNHLASDSQRPLLNNSQEVDAFLKNVISLNSGHQNDWSVVFSDPVFLQYQSESWFCQSLLQELAIGPTSTYTKMNIILPYVLQWQENSPALLHPIFEEGISKIKNSNTVNITVGTNENSHYDYDYSSDPVHYNGYSDDGSHLPLYVLRIIIGIVIAVIAAMIRSS